MVCEELLNKAGTIDEFVIELTLVAASPLEDDELLEVIKKLNVSDGAISSILSVNLPLSSSVTNTVSQYRPNLDLSILNQYMGKDRAISLDDQAITFGDYILQMDHCDPVEDKSYIFKNLQIVPLANRVSEADLEKIAKPNCGPGTPWSCGKPITTDLGNGITEVVCNAPPQRKCMKRLDGTNWPGLRGQMFIDNILDPAQDVYQKAGFIIDNDGLDEPDIFSEIMKRTCEFGAFAIQSLLLAEDDFTDEQLSHIVYHSNISDKVVEAVMLMNAPLSLDIENIIVSERPNVDLINVTSNENKDMFFFMGTESQLYVGQDLRVQELPHGRTKVKIKFYEIIDLPFTATSDNLDKLSAGCNTNKWVKGERVLYGGSSNGSSTWVRCATPPEVKCVKIKR